MHSISKREIWTFFTTVFITGMAVLIVEVAAVRQLTPVFGGSIYVLSSVLSVILLALSLGYFVGGRLSDRYPTPTVLYFVITASGLFLLLLQLSSIHVLSDLVVASLVIGPLFVSLAFFFLPALLLGMDSPYVIKLITHESDEAESGKYVGTTFFWSTIGSITGSLAAGFWLIPTLGVHATITYTALLLVALGVIAPLFLIKTNLGDYCKKHLVYFLTVLLLAIALVTFIKSASTPATNVLFQSDGLYSRIQVLETTHQNLPTRSLHRDRNHSSAIFLDSYDHVFAYSQYVDFYDNLVTNPENFLLIGGGAYTIPRRLVEIDPLIQVDVVEIEPVLYELAQTYFDLQDISRITNYVQDARIFLTETDKTYDFIFSDAFNTSHTMPWQLGTREFYEGVKKILNPEGVLMLNYIGGADTNPNNMTSTFLNTIEQSFTHVAMYRTQALHDERLQNFIIIASQSPIDTESIADEIIDTKINGPITVAELRIDIQEFNQPNRSVFTDDIAPIEYLMGRQFRDYMKAY